MPGLSQMGKRLRKKREEMKVTQLEMAEKLDLTVQFYGNIERGKQSPSIEIFVKIANLMNVSADYLLQSDLNVHDTITINESFSELSEMFQGLNKENIKAVTEINKILVDKLKKSQLE